MKFLFWNVNKNSIERILSAIVEEHNVEVVVLAECPDKLAVLSSLNSDTQGKFHLTDTGKTRVVIYTRFSRQFIVSEHHDDILTVRRLCLPRRREILLAAIHFPSKLYMTERDQASMASRVSEEIRKVESRVGHSRTLLVGDLNMNPFDEGMTSADGLHAVMSKDIARRKPRTVHRKSYPFFYNPMWGRFGDTTEGPPGTFYRSASSFVEYFWHMFDQVLVRPELLGSFDIATLRILTECRATKFIRPSGVPNASRLSDHLPLVFELKM